MAILGLGDPPETLPIDAAMAELEAAFSRLRDYQAEAEEDIARLGPVEPGWATSGTSAAAVIEGANGSVLQHVLGEWEKGGHGVTVAGDHPLNVPTGWNRYIVRAYSGPIDHHAYFRISPDLVIHTYGSGTRIGNAICRSTQGVELVSRELWRSWSPETRVMAFGMARATRDDRHTYCSVFRGSGDGQYIHLTYTPEGRPFLLPLEEPQPLVITERADAAARIFTPITQE
ncbi:hypothetical protein [Sphingosinicella sp. YJ22]|uniref:hypothetical protein n=1 Tax=Sphingosinicella sp. YJ22 TaxID=1104780 RepID=UPI001409D8BF|nr:hypothetical protein [Sphingosinicella sp. YJ22]